MKQDTPKYLALHQWIHEQVAAGKFHGGDKFFSENELSAMFGMSRQTVRQAVGLLEREGMLERRRGSGTYIAAQIAARVEPAPVVGVISTYLDDYIFPSIIRGIESALTRRGYGMRLSFTHNRVDNEARALELMLNTELCGLIVEPTKSALPNPNKAQYEEFQRRGVPVVFFNAVYPELSFPLVALDDREAGYAATTRLLRAGCQRIAAILQSDDRQGHLRYEGYLRALHEAGIPFRDERVLWYDTEDIPTLLKAGGRLLSRLGDCTGLFCYNDRIAFHAIEQLRLTGSKVPEDISVVGIDNSELAMLAETPLTTVAHPMESLGSLAAERLMRLREEPQFDASFLFPADLIERESVRGTGIPEK